ncbi:MAG TPA: hypothetical protein VKE40_04465 [Gemmataceae bacterium]|nr:hypothetical protein [Gemmataceae bacterium]
MIRRHWPVLSIAAAVFAAGLNLQAQPPADKPPTAPTSTSTTPAPTADVSLKELIARQAALEKQYKAFTTSLLSLAQKLEKSDRIEDKDKAKALRKAIDLADKEGVDNKFTTLLRTLMKSAGDPSLSDINSAKSQNDDLIKVLKEILAILQSDDELERIRNEMKYLQQLLAELNALIRQTDINRARTDSGRGDNKQLAKDQDKLAKGVDALANKMGQTKPKSGDGEPKAGEKGEGKPGDDKAGENKEDTKDAKASEREKGDPAHGEGAESKPSKGPMAGSASEGTKSPPKDGAGSGSKGSGEKKEPMTGDKSDKPAETRNKEDNKGDEKGAAIGAKSDAQASAGKGAGSPSGGSPSGQPKPSGGSPSPGTPPPNAPKAPGSDQVRRAVPDEENAAGALDENKRPKASDDLGSAADKLRAAREELEKRLKQLREQELERILANLEQRVNKMLAMQIEVKSATVAINTQILKHPEKKAQPVDFQNAQKQEDKEGEIIAEADKAIQLLVSEGSAVAFPAVFEEVRKDMLRVKERLHDANVGEDTQGIEQDIIEALTHMRDALKKAQQELGKQPPGPPGNPPDGPQLQKLLDMIAELKMIRQLQVQVNDRTKRYGIRNGTNVEQSDDPQIKKELRDLSDRQDRLETMVNNIVTKKNQ